MATVPGVLYLSTYMGQGGNPPLFNIAPLGNQLKHMNDRELYRFVPMNSNGTQGSGYKPWYDGSAGALLNVDEAGSSSTTIKVTPNPGWTTNEHVGKAATLVNPTAILGISPQRVYSVGSNTSDTITIASGSITYDGIDPTAWQVRLGTGRFTVYHAVTGFVGPLEGGGSAWQAAGTGIGPDVRMVPELAKRVYTTSPYFNFAKICTASALATHWILGGANRTSLLAELQKISAAAALEGNVIRWECVVVDVADNDLAELAANPALVTTHLINYQTNMTDLINWLRSSSVLQNTSAPYNFVSNANIKAQITNPHPDLWGVGAAGAAAFMRTGNFSIAGSLTGVGLIEMADAAFAPLAETPETCNLNAERKFYSFQSMIDFGEKSVTLLQRQLLGLSSAVAVNGFPLYFMGGDSIAVGPINPLWMANSASLTLIGPGPTGTVKPEGQYIFNGVSNQFERYNANTNSNTSGTVNTQAGPEASVIAALALQHPNGFGLVKRASNGATLIRDVPYDPGSGGSGGRWAKVSGEHYTQTLSLIASAKSFINSVYGKQADFRGCLFSIGHNDCVSPETGAAAAAALPTFCQDLWLDLTTRTSGKDFPIVFRRPQLEVAVNQSAMSTFRAALESLAKTKGQVRWFDVDDLERDRIDNLHETPESAIIQGRRAAAALVSASI
jgi:hypothetical protein